MVRRLLEGTAARRRAWLGVVMTSAVVVVPGARILEPQTGGWCALAAWATCLVSGWLGWRMIERWPAPEEVLLGVVAALTTRTGIPLVVCMVVYLRVPVLADAGFVYYLLIFYFVTLVTMTILQVAGVAAHVALPLAARAEANGRDHG